MKKLMLAAMVAGSMIVMADEPAKKDNAKAAAPVAVQPDARKQLTPEQRAEMRAKREKFMSERKAKLEAAQLEVLKKYGIEGEKAKELLRELQQAMRASSPFGRGMTGERRRPKSVATPEAAEPKK